MNKYALTDSSPEAVAWRRKNKARVRRENPKRGNPMIWIWIAVVVCFVIAWPLGILAFCVAMFLAWQARAT